MTSSAEILGPRFQDEDWIVRLGACHGLASFGMKIAGPYLDQMLRLVDDDEGPVVAAAAAAVSRLLQDKPERRFQLYGVVRRLQARLPIEEGDPWVRAGCCQGIGSIGLSIEETVQVLSKHLTDTEVIVVEAAAEALRRLRDSGAIAGKVLEDEAKEGASRLLSSEWLSRWAACVCLGALGSAALPYIQDLQARMQDEDENRIVHDAAKVSLNRLQVVQRHENIFDRSLERLQTHVPSIAYQVPDRKSVV